MGPRTSSMSSETLMIGFERVLPTPGITLATFFTCLGSQPVRPHRWHTLVSNLGQMVVWAVKGHTAAEGMGTPAEEGQQHPCNKKWWVLVGWHCAEEIPAVRKRVRGRVGRREAGDGAIGGGDHEGGA